MNSSEILKYCIEKGLLVDKEVLKLLSDTVDIESAKLVVEKIREITHQRIITKKTFDKSKNQVSQFFLDFPEKKQKSLEKLKIKLGLNIEVSKEISNQNKLLEKNSLLNSRTISSEKGESNLKEADFKSFGKHISMKDSLVKVSEKTILNKKIDVQDFVGHFRRRYAFMKNILQDRSELEGLVSINKISGQRQKISLIGLVYEKKITKNKNILLIVEDLTGKIRILINKNKSELYEKAEDIALDSVIGIKGSGSREMIFASDVIFPESIILERKKSPEEEYALFIGDVHVGSKLFLEENFLKFVDYLNGNLPEANLSEVKKIKYLFISGDLVAGVGIYPGQEKELAIVDLEEQFEKAAELLGKIRKDIKIIIASGNHDGVRIMEPQPKFDEKYAWPLHDLKNVILVTNPSEINIASKKGFSGFNVLVYHGYSFHYYANNIPSLIKAKAVHSPEKIIKYLLKNRHLAPTHSSTLYFPSEEDKLMIRQVPDIFFSGHTHKSAVSYYNNILIISSSCWESKTSFQERMGNEPDFCKVPMLNLKTRAVKILDFE